MLALEGYLKEQVQAGLKLRDTFRHVMADGSLWEVTGSDIQRIVEAQADASKRRLYEQLLALGEYSTVPAAERRRLFANEFKEDAWPKVSRSWYFRVVRDLAVMVAHIQGSVIAQGATSEYSWGDCDIYWRVLSVDADADRYRLRSEYRMSVSGRNIVFAESSDEIIAEWVCSEYPEVAEIFTPVLGGRCDFRIWSRELGQTGPFQEVRFHRDRELRSQFDREHPETRDATVVFWRTDDFGGARNHQVKLVCEWDLQFSWNYFQWSAPHDVWLRSFRADLSAFRAMLDGTVLSILPAFAAPAATRVDTDLLLCEAEFDGWVHPGQSLRVDWGS